MIIITNTTETSNARDYTLTIIRYAKIIIKGESLP